MAKRRRRFTRAFKLAALAKLAEASSVTALAGELGICREMLHKWRLAYEEGGAGTKPLVTVAFSTAARRTRSVSPDRPSASWRHPPTPAQAIHNETPQQRNRAAPLATA
jgi:transposase-like protein